MSAALPEGSKPFQFTGTANEWFGIWIVNLMLSIVTIGVYSAWAKVRTKKYFYNHTFAEGRNFDYHATGRPDIKGPLDCDWGADCISNCADCGAAFGIAAFTCAAACLSVADLAVHDVQCPHVQLFQCAFWL